MARYHVEVRGYPGIAYHYVIGPDGTIFHCNDDELFTWHGHDFNTGLGVCLTGDFTSKWPTEAQLASAAWLYREKRKTYGAGLRVVGHKEAPTAKTACPGDTWPQWRGKILGETIERPSVLCPFYQTNPERGAPSVDVIANSAMGAIRALHIDEMPQNPMPSKEIHARLYTYGDNWEMFMALEGRAGAERYFEICRPRYDRLKALGIYHVSGINEPHPQNIDQLRTMNEFQMRLGELIGNYGMHYWCWDWGVGWPDYGLAQHWIGAVKVARQTGGGLCVHLYGAPDVFQNTHYPDEHYSLRVYNHIRELYEAGLEPGERWIIIGECGIDGGIIEWGKEPFTGPRRRGWRDWSDWVYHTPNGLRIMDEVFYWERLSAYDDVLKTIPEVRWAFAFLAHPREDWADFTLTQYILDHMAEKHNIVQPGQPAFYLPSNDPLTMAANTIPAIVEKARWWLEEEQRQREAGRNDYADAIRKDVINLMYRAERLAKE
jgi:hypothetical protein